MATPDPKKAAVERMMERFGGGEQFFKVIDKRYEEFASAWNQDTERLGRVLRAHLAVEHFLTAYLVARNPNLGSIEKARLSYAQKVELLDQSAGFVSVVLPGLRLLGQIRNRIAHKLRVELTEEDERAFLDIGLFRATREENKKRFPEAKDPNADDSRLAVLEEFAKFAAGLLHAGADPDEHIWKDAMKEFVEANDGAKK